jgi:hypothetical protein
VFCGDKEGVAIQTTVGRLEAHFGNVALQKVRYAEPKASGRTLTLDDVAILKRPFFDFEKEARAIFRDDTPSSVRQRRVWFSISVRPSGDLGECCYPPRGRHLVL